jgi:hypothetical protein
VDQAMEDLAGKQQTGRRLGRLRARQH